MLHEIGTLYKIAAFLLNQFGKPVTVDSELSLKIIDRMKSLKNTDNTLAKEVEEKGWLRKKIVFQRINSHDLSDFPQLDETQLKLFFTGSYQYSQAIAYLAEILDNDNTLHIDFVKDESNILKLCVRSRHIARKSYKCFIEYIPQKHECDGITRHFCECPNGRRTLATILLATYVSADSLDNQLTTVDSVFGISASSITSVLMEYMGTIVEYLFEMFDLKMRTIRFLVSLYTDENLHLFKRYINISQSFIGWLANVIPDSTHEATFRFLTYLFPQEDQSDHEKPHPEPAMPSLIHSMSLGDYPSGRENRLEEDQKVADVSPFADQVLSLNNLINARSSMNRRK
ncbi:unnamed protein product [Psylliodes chrysocephalus]|uniref:Uncharacterized protein n=1 Tax=Psylliodes chrysocephalus TaxID=3402493 RepID=A0A9P0CR34_9CUCU|nr:unnamed protein product [Psylliodes chrysocephala]